ncbi:MAG: hypothetical protein H6500_01185 [Candidatus Woesearchaeota archaeon]|nr:hypothetical protein [Nanoarchaeota archaeon]USN44446.1 MAG: hypothetical protein H6500_01185 [Candidatus Woesearchaeota archaeon]
MKDVYVLGLQLGHNSSAALLCNGRVLAAISEEKFDNIKNSSAFPLKSISWLLEREGIKGEDLAAVVHSSYYCACSQMIVDPILANKKRSEIGFSFLSSLAGKVEVKVGASQNLRSLLMQTHFLALERESKKAKKIFESLLKKHFSIDSSKLHYVRHHLAHSYYGYFGQNNVKADKSLIITMDGSGEKEFATISIADKKKKKITLVSSSRWDSSIGYVYAATTKYLGMKPIEHEYKVMGLAPYAKDYYKKTYEKIFKDIIEFDEKTLEFHSSFPLTRFDLYLLEKAKYERFDNVAAALQEWTERTVTTWIEAAIKKYGIDELYFSGGLFMNVKLNQRITEMKSVKKAYFIGSCGDESNCIGAGYIISQKLDPKTELLPLENFYLGNEYCNEDVEAFIKEKNLEKKYDVEYFEDIEEKTAELLSQDCVVARVKGRCEWGARALGNRSILANPSKMENFFKVNDQVKMRDFWMPFAPSLLIEDHKLYVSNPKNYKAPYMILSFHSTVLGQDKLRAALHQADKTLRAQLVEKEVNPSYHRLISLFKEKTGIGGVLNTSFNLHGYPLVSSLKQALFTFENCKLEYLCLENYVISKKKK